ncbi:RNA polymerase subunit sigma-70 [Arthrobacter crusticola]|uniref:RNA polymerase subunit sigma-70 n=1 Tax=Arthrobacter crusticola TaxID=2547960 RepID=A0A4R5U0L7_9MICC|nr:RNA polymerase subunit sigma-70 [Arthrobacter crusticola]
MSTAEARARAESVARASYGRLLALLAAPTGDLQAAEDALADAFLRALTTWPVSGIPENPEAWLFAVSRNRQRDRYRSAAYRTSVPLEPDAGSSGADPPGGTSRGAGSLGGIPSPGGSCSALPGAVHWDEVDVEAIPDRRLSLLFVCAHPAIDPGVRTPLMLQVVLGVPSDRIAAAFAVPTPAMAQRLVRAKRRIREARIPFVLPDMTVLKERLPAVLEAVYGAYALDWRSRLPGARRVRAGAGTGEPAGAGSQLQTDADSGARFRADADTGTRNQAGPDCGAQSPADEDAWGRSQAGSDADPPESLAAEALYLATVLTELLPDEPEVHGLAALICLSLARGTARTASAGGFVPLALQDTSLWHRDLIARGEEHLRRAHPLGRIGRFQLEAAMQSVHCARARTGRTDWQALLRLNEALVALTPTLGGIVSLASTLGEASGPDAALSFLDAANAPALEDFQPAWATRAHLLTQAGRTTEAAGAYGRALALTTDPALRGFLEGALQRLTAPGPPAADTD